jgi:hypothetical protein
VPARGAARGGVVRVPAGLLGQLDRHGHCRGLRGVHAVRGGAAVRDVAVCLNGRRGGGQGMRGVHLGQARALALHRLQGARRWRVRLPLRRALLARARPRAERSLPLPACRRGAHLLSPARCPSRYNCDVKNTPAAGSTRTLSCAKSARTAPRGSSRPARRVRTRRATTRARRARTRRRALRATTARTTTSTSSAPGAARPASPSWAP